MGQPCTRVRFPGLQPYEPVWQAMRRFTDERGEHCPDACWLVEHEPVFTLGQAGRDEHVLDAGDIPLVRTDRGGQVTYHGPGQVVIYPLLQLKRLNLGVKALVHGLEQVVLDYLHGLDLPACRRPGAPGVYLDDAKIAALGLRIRHGCSYHGLAFNVAMDLEPFRRIHPCGYAGMNVTQLSRYRPDLGWQTVADGLLSGLARQFSLEWIE